MDNWQRYKQRLRQIIELECDGSRMNNTKWMEMLDVLAGLPLQRCVKWLDRAEVSSWTNHMQGGFSSWLPTPYIENPGSPSIVLSLEWMEIDPVGSRDRVDYGQEIERRLQSVGVPYTWEKGVIRVTGHVRKPTGERGRNVPPEIP